MDAFVVESVRHFEISQDGQNFVVHSNQASTLTLHHSVLQAMLVATAHAIGVSERIRCRDRRARYTMQCESWEVSRGDPDGELVLTFFIRGRAELSFSLDDRQLPRLIEVLAAAAGLGPQGAPPGTFTQ
ncbi:MAG: hypothetical protein ACRYHA_30510 [Janthinobacterium lividum]